MKIEVLLLAIWGFLVVDAHEQVSIIRFQNPGIFFEKMRNSRFLKREWYTITTINADQVFNMRDDLSKMLSDLLTFEVYRETESAQIYSLILILQEKLRYLNSIKHSYELAQLDFNDDENSLFREEGDTSLGNNITTDVFMAMGQLRLDRMNFQMTNWSNKVYVENEVSVILESMSRIQRQMENNFNALNTTEDRNLGALQHLLNQIYDVTRGCMFAAKEIEGILKTTQAFTPAIDFGQILRLIEINTKSKLPISTTKINTDTIKTLFQIKTHISAGQLITYVKWPFMEQQSYRTYEIKTIPVHQRDSEGNTFTALVQPIAKYILYTNTNQLIYMQEGDRQSCRLIGRECLCDKKPPVNTKPTCESELLTKYRETDANTCKWQYIKAAGVTFIRTNAYNLWIYSSSSPVKAIARCPHEQREIILNNAGKLYVPPRCQVEYDGTTILGTDALPMRSWGEPIVYVPPNALVVAAPKSLREERISKVTDTIYVNLDATLAEGALIAVIVILCFVISCIGIYNIKLMLRKRKNQHKNTAEYVPMRPIPQNLTWMFPRETHHYAVPRTPIRRVEEGSVAPPPSPTPIRTTEAEEK